MSDVDYERLDRLLGALGESVASRVHLGETALSESSSIPETLPAAWRDTATAVQVDTLPRGVPLQTVVHGVLGHFLPAAAVVFGSAMVINAFRPPTFPTGTALWPGLLYNLAFGAWFGFLVGAAFAIALGVVYRRYAVEELRAWKVGLWGGQQRR
jgi:hypothetical protein